MSKIQNFEGLIIWQESRELVSMIYKQFTTVNDRALKEQIQRAAVSVMNNIAEGFERESDKEFKRFLLISKASCGEVRSMLYIVDDLGLLQKDKVEDLKNRCLKLSGSIANFIKYLDKSIK